MRPLRFLTISLLLVLLAGGAGCGSKSHPELELGGIDLGEVFDGIMKSAHRTLGGVSDLATAKAAVPELKRINEDFDDLIYHIPKLSEKGQMEMAQRARTALPQIQDVTQRILTFGQIGDTLGPEMENMVAKLTEMAQ